MEESGASGADGPAGASKRRAKRMLASAEVIDLDSDADAHADTDKEGPTPKRPRRVAAVASASKTKAVAEKESETKKEKKPAAGSSARRGSKKRGKKDADSDSDDEDGMSDSDGSAEGSKSESEYAESESASAKGDGGGDASESDGDWSDGDGSKKQRANKRSKTTKTPTLKRQRGGRQEASSATPSARRVKQQQQQQHEETEAGQHTVTPAGGLATTSREEALAMLSHLGPSSSAKESTHAHMQTPSLKRASIAAGAGSAGAASSFPGVGPFPTSSASVMLSGSQEVGAVATPATKPVGVGGRGLSSSGGRGKQELPDEDNGNEAVAGGMSSVAKKRRSSSRGGGSSAKGRRVAHDESEQDEQQAGEAEVGKEADSVSSAGDSGEGGAESESESESEWEDDGGKKKKKSKKKSTPRKTKKDEAHTAPTTTPKQQQQPKNSPKTSTGAAGVSASAKAKGKVEKDAESAQVDEIPAGTQLRFKSPAEFVRPSQSLACFVVCLLPVLSVCMRPYMAVVLVTRSCLHMSCMVGAWGMSPHGTGDHIVYSDELGWLVRHGCVDPSILPHVLCSSYPTSCVCLSTLLVIGCAVLMLCAVCVKQEHRRLRQCAWHVVSSRVCVCVLCRTSALVMWWRPLM